MSLVESRFLRACRVQPADRTPVWLMRQAGRYMPEYRAVRRQHSILEICKTPQLAAEVTITAAEALGVDAAIIFADLLLPLEPLGMKFHFAAGEGPQIEDPLRNEKQIAALRDDSSAELGYVAESVRLVAKHFGERLPVIGFCGAPFTLASYMVEGGGSRNYIETKRLMYARPAAWDMLMRKLVRVLGEYAAAQVAAGAAALQVFDSWVGCLGPADYVRYVLLHTTDLIKRLRSTGAPVIYFGTDTATLLAEMQRTGADVMGVDWRFPIDEAWQKLDWRGAVQGNLDPVALFAPWAELKVRIDDVLARAGNRPGHIFNLGHGILPETPVENVKALVSYVHDRTEPQATTPEPVAVASQNVSSQNPGAP
jgi:uroporphyrinogen decarboxylase